MLEGDTVSLEIPSFNSGQEFLESIMGNGEYNAPYYFLGLWCQSAILNGTNMFLSP